MAVFFDLFIPMDRDKFMLMGELLMINISAPFLIYFTCLITFFEFNPHIPGLISAISLIIILLTADIQKGGDTVSNLPFFNFSPRNLDKLFFVTIILELILVINTISFAKPSPIEKMKPKRLLIKASIIVIGIAISGTILLSSIKFYDFFEDNIKKLESYFVRYGSKGMRKGLYYTSTRTIDLRKPMNEQFRSEREEIILRATTKSPPGYLRARVYDNYNNGNWVVGDKIEFKKLNSKSYEGILVYKTFFTGSKVSPLIEKIEILLSTNFKTDVLLVPGNYEQIDIVAERLSWNKNGVLSPEEWEKSGGYTVYVKSIQPESAYSPPEIENDEELSSHLSVPIQLYELLDKEITKIFGNTYITDNMSDIEIAKIIQNYFTSNYKYSLDFAIKAEDIDPLEAFFRRRRAHCELFATSVVLIARRLGIPARYVTGFICFEKAPMGNYYVSRVENAHAWAEIYDRKEKKWFLIEATPEEGIPFSKEKNWSFIRTHIDLLSKTAQDILSYVRRGLFAKAVLTLLTSLYEVLREIVWHPLRGPLLVIAILLALFLKIIVNRRKQRAKWLLSEEIFRLTLEFTKFERKLTRVTGIIRDKSMTIDEWFAKIAKEPFDYLIGSVHYTDDFPFDNPEIEYIWKKDNTLPDKVWPKYLELVDGMVSSEKLNIIGHFDIPKKFGYFPSNMDSYLSDIYDIFKKAAANEMAIEINSSGLRKPVKEIYPSLKLLKLAKEAGLYITFGSDAHAPEEVGADFDRSIILAKEAGFSEYALFTKKSISLQALPE